MPGNRAILERTRAVVTHPDPQLSAAKTHLNIDRAPRRMTAGVCQRLLHDPVCRELNARVKGTERARHDETDAGT